MARIDPRAAPRASRRPNSRVRRLTAVAMTAAMPVTVMTRASAAKEARQPTDGPRAARFGYS